MMLISLRTLSEIFHPDMQTGRSFGSGSADRSINEWVGEKRPIQVTTSFEFFTEPQPQTTDSISTRETKKLIKAIVQVALSHAAERKFLLFSFTNRCC